MIPRNGQEFRCRIGRLQNSPTEVSGFAAYAEPESAPRKGSSPTLLLNTETLEISWPAHRPSSAFDNYGRVVVATKTKHAKESTSESTQIALCQTMA